jgi:NAD(P)-dependent dehydrogenase (short-subunit alcohol dehydrogenase family)
VALGRAIAKMGEPKGIRANVVAPGYVDTPLGQFTTPSGSYW